MNRMDLQAQGDRDRAERLLAEHEIRSAVEKLEKQAPEAGARRHLLGAAMRLTPEMAPDVHEVVDGCRARLGIETSVETYVYPAPMFNAAAVRPEGGRLFVICSSSLLEAFEADELRFVVGHELGHHLFEHHRIPVAGLLAGTVHLSPGLAMRLFAWQRYAEISADRAGLYCAGGLEPAANALFKLASGLRGGRVQVRIDQFLEQVADLREESARTAHADEPGRADWFSTHPFSPLRVKAAQLFAGSELMSPGGTTRDGLELAVQDLMLLMEPSYLQEKSEVASAMRRLLFAAGVAVAAVAGEVNDEVVAELERLLGAGSVPLELNVEAIRADLSRRIADVKESVPILRRAQVIRDLCVIARADGGISEAERALIRQIAADVQVDSELVRRFAEAAAHPGCAGEGEGGGAAAG